MPIPCRVVLPVLIRVLAVPSLFLFVFVCLLVAGPCSCLCCSLFFCVVLVISFCPMSCGGSSAIYPRHDSPVLRLVSCVFVLFLQVRVALFVVLFLFPRFFLFLLRCLPCLLSSRLFVCIGGLDGCCFIRSCVSVSTNICICMCISVCVSVCACVCVCVYKDIIVHIYVWWFACVLA